MKIVYQGPGASKLRRSFDAPNLLFWLFFLAFSPAAIAQLSGNVYRDFNGDGTQQTSFPTEPGVSGIQVRAYLTGSTTPLTTNTDSLGSFSFEIASGKKVRVEFSNLPYESYESTPGQGNGSAVQFVTTPVSAVNLGIIDPLSYCSNITPNLVASCFVMGDPLAEGTNSGSLASIVHLPYSASGQGAAPNPLATSAMTGTVWGGAYRRQDKALFFSAFLKRHSGLGSLGLGGVYRSDLLGESPETIPYLDLAKFVRLSSPADSILIANRVLPADFKVPSLDSMAFGMVGKVGIGGIALTPDENSLWVVNLFQKTLVRIPLTKPAGQLVASDINSYTLPNPGCVAGQSRPWALEYHEGSLYVGMTCDAGAIGGTRDNLRAYVYRYDLKTSQFINSPIISEALNYRKGWVHAGVPQSEYWEPWTDTFGDLTTSLLNTEGGIPTYRASRPQPILSDIEFDTDGSLIIGLMDRTGHQTSRNQFSIPSSAARYSGYIGGDILRAQVYANGTYKLEKNGKSGQRSGTGADNNQGPGGGEFYGDDLYKDAFTGEVIQQETFMGSMVVVPGNDEVVAAVIEPFTVWTGGMAWYSNLSGNRMKAFEIYNGENNEQYLGKANGLGSIRALCEAAPILIGNRLWVDANKNGIQDPDEVPLAGASVGLYDAKGKLVSQIASEEDGTYLFGGGTVKPNSTYYIALGASSDSPQFDKPQKVLSVENKAYRLVSTSQTATQKTTESQIGNRAQIAGADMPANLQGFPAMMVKTGAPGQSQLNFDAAFEDCWVDAGRDTTVCAGVDSLKLPIATTGQTWTAAAGNPSPATVNQSGQVKGLANAGIYRFIMTQSQACIDTVSVTVKPALKVQAIIERVTCTDLNANSDGRIDITGFKSDEKFNVQVGTAGFLFDTPQAIPSNGSIINDLSNPTAASQSYLVRIYNDSGCTQDVRLTMMQRDCQCGDFKALCIPVNVRRIKLQ
ncbi:SdrD B-like domain-containing protein [Persicitalea sp.]|uniref:SdrD B-like domain-containing protein n=1 Tax=Persicitalea sp. TaxID=3100273 RepID=UPI0035930C66